MNGDTTTEKEGFTVELRLFANFREAVGSKTIERSFTGTEIRVGEVLKALEEEYPDLSFFDDEGAIREYISILKNGNDIVHLEGKDTLLEAGDRLSLFPPVAGG